MEFRLGLLGLVALPQMLRLGYDKNLAIGTDRTLSYSANTDTPAQYITISKC